MPFTCLSFPSITCSIPPSCHCPLGKHHVLHWPSHSKTHQMPSSMPTVCCVTLNSFRYSFLHWLQNCTMVNKCLKWWFRLSGDLLKSECSKWTVGKLGRDITRYQTIKCEGVYGSSTSALDTYVGYKGLELRPTFTFVITVRSSQHVRGELFQWPFGLSSQKLCPTKVVEPQWVWQICSRTEAVNICSSILPAAVKV